MSELQSTVSLSSRRRTRPFPGVGVATWASKARFSSTTLNSSLRLVVVALIDVGQLLLQSCVASL